MSSEVALYITRYGYLAIFCLVLLQELGVPNPVTNEFVLLFSGYLAFSGVLSLGGCCSLQSPRIVSEPQFVV